MYQLALLYLALAVLAGLLALLTSGTVQLLAAITCAVLLVLCAVAFIAGLLPRSLGGRHPPG